MLQLVYLCLINRITLKETDVDISYLFLNQAVWYPTLEFLEGRFTHNPSKDVNPRSTGIMSHNDICGFFFFFLAYFCFFVCLLALGCTVFITVHGLLTVGAGFSDCGTGCCQRGSQNLPQSPAVSPAWKADS